MASNIYMEIKKKTKWNERHGIKCCVMSKSHYAIIAKGNILDNMEAIE